MERLIPVSWTHEEHGLQAWTALSYLLYVNNNLSRAAYLAQKSVFWDLYCAAPERHDTCEHSSEAKAFHDYVVWLSV
ncbi:uncharacterized protein LOC142324704 isoform X6 [Lycorma delicatula]|uniref:uncharacterized protein LOC142324704 isoform X6 n=1 Tax=Lycorma delicatula TaxID=130591 RepID=UPI003F513F8A